MQSSEDKESMQFYEEANTNLHGLHWYSMGGVKTRKVDVFGNCKSMQILTFIRFVFFKKQPIENPCGDGS